MNASVFVDFLPHDTRFLPLGQLNQLGAIYFQPDWNFS